MKKFILIAIFIVLGIGTASADLSDGFFCLIRKDNVNISLKQTAGYYKCRDTIASLEQLMINTAKDLNKIQTYIYRGRDVEYRSTIKTEKQDLLDTLQLSRKTIIANMKTFENNLIQKAIKYFVISINPYKIKLQKSLVKIDAIVASGFSTHSINSYATLLRAQVTTIDGLSKATTMAELRDLLPKYIYLKKEIEGKYE